MADSAGVMRPSDDELDLFGITHTGKVRATNQDHFLVATVHPQVVIHGTSLPKSEELPLRGTRLATMLVVADGVGGAVAGSDAAQLATESVTHYVSSSLNSYHEAGQGTEGLLLEALRGAAMHAHEAVLSQASENAEQRGMATTLTLCIVVYPWAYIVQVGDSRAYHFRNGELIQLTRDQTIGQSLVDQGLMPQERLHLSPFKHVLSSAIGASEAAPDVTRFDISERGSLIMLCSDGLTKHVENSEIADRIASMTSSEELAKGLLDLALERGGTDNITIVAGRAPLTVT
ncbi:MAG: protein phosphatase 2C domain-containing protein [Gemmatimonadaceae bacterium]